MIGKQRYALLGWLVWQLGKRAAKKRARSLTPSRGGGGGSSLPLALAVPAVAALGAAAWFFFRRGGDDVDLPE